MRGPRVDCGVPVICVGNFTAGGAGKTPTAIYVAGLLQAHGERVTFLSRGYGGTLARGGQPVLVDPARHAASAVGDEPLLLARIAPVVVCADRIAGAMAAKAAGATVIVMDDGLQSGRLHHTLALGVIDGAVGFGNGLCVPAGPLRAPLAEQAAFVAAQVLIGNGAVVAAGTKPLFHASLQPEPQAAADLKSSRVLAFAGIGRPEKFFATLAATGADIVQACAFGDHHAYSASELARLVAQAARQDLRLVTTEKDAVRLPQNWFARHGVLTLPVCLQFERAAEFSALVLKAIGRS